MCKLKDTRHSKRILLEIVLEATGRKDLKNPKDGKVTSLLVASPARHTELPKIGNIRLIMFATSWLRFVFAYMNINRFSFRLNRTVYRLLCLYIIIMHIPLDTEHQPNSSSCVNLPKQMWRWLAREILKLNRRQVWSNMCVKKIAKGQSYASLIHIEVRVNSKKWNEVILKTW